jgi:hypothetical protein
MKLMREFPSLGKRRTKGGRWHLAHGGLSVVLKASCGFILHEVAEELQGL